MVFSAGSLSLLLGFLVLIGWHADIITLLQILPGLVPMQYNTALSFLLCGISLIVLLNDKKAPGVLFSLLAGIIGLLTLTQYIFNVSIGLDELFMEHSITVATSHPGRMAPNTALSFLLFCIGSILTIQNQKRVQFAGVLGSLIFGLGLVAFTGYLVGVEATYGWGEFTRMAMHTAIGFVFLGIGLTALSFLKESDFKVDIDTYMPPWLPGYAATISITILLIDLSLPDSVAAGILYVLLVLFGWFIANIRVTLLLALTATVLTLFGWFFSHPEADFWAIAADRILTICVIWLTATLLYGIKKRTLALQKLYNKLDEKVAKRTQELNAKNKEMEQFLYIASHDLKEPLRAIKGFAKVIEEDYEEKLNDDIKRYLQFISDAATRMSELVKGLLDHSRLGKNKKQNTINFGEVLEAVQKDLIVAISESNTVLEASDLPNIRGLEVEIRLLLQNLISNAIKFRKKDLAPVICITAKEKKHHWKFSIQDNGIGIAENHKEKIFDIFQRLHDSKEYEGTGIGLAHCKKIVELHGGNIWVESEINKGSTFHFTISKKLDYAERMN